VKGLPLGRKLWRFAWSLDEHGAYRAASAMAFDAFLSLVPLLALSGWALQAFDRGHILLDPLLAALPGEASGLAEADLLRVSDRAIMALAPLGTFGFVWLSSSGIATAMGVCETIFAAERRSWLRRRVIALLWVIVAIVAVVTATAIEGGLTTTLGAKAGRVVGAMLALPALVALVVGFFRTSIRRPRGMRRRVIQGAVLTVALWVVASLILSTYAKTVARYSFFYGSLAAVAMTLAWLWLVSISLLVGGEVNAQLEGVREFPPSTMLDRPLR
jgi:membrane protein